MDKIEKFILSQKWEFVWGDEEEYSVIDPVLMNYGNNLITKYGIGLHVAAVYNKDIYTEFFVTKTELELFAKSSFDFLMKNNNYKNFLNDIRISSQKLIRHAQELPQIIFKELTNKELLLEWSAYDKKISNIFTLYSLTDPIAITKLEKELVSFLKKIGYNNESTLGILTQTKSRFIFSKSHDKILSFSETTKKEDYKIDFGVFNKQLYKTAPRSQIRRQKLIEKLDLPKKIIKICDIISELAEERLKLRYTWMRAYIFYEFFNNEFKRRSNLDKDLLRYYNLPEIKKLINNKIKISSAVIEERSKGTFKILRNGRIYEYNGKVANELHENIVQLEKNIVELSGVVASRGIIEGRVVLLSYKNAHNHSAKISKMEEGDILVTEMTHPNIIIACKKAGAIITDEGGMLSHAAIVSRELKKPCVINTKIATKTLKDGDRVVVDAINGKVIIK